MRKQTQEGKGKKRSGHSSPNTSNYCTGCGKNLGGNITPTKMREHKCEDK